MTAPLGRAFVEVMADLSKFTPGLRQKVKAALDEQTKGMPLEELDKSMEKAGEHAAEDVGRGLDNKIENETNRSGRKGGLSFSKGFSAVLGGLGAALMPSLIALGVEAAAALAPAALAIGGTFPAAIFSLIGTMAVLKMATHGIGDALKSAFDPSKAAQFNEAMKKLAPAAQTFVRNLQAFHPVFHQLQQDIQQTFFAQLNGAFVRATNQLIPRLRVGLHQLSIDLGQMGRGLLQAFGNGRQDIASIFIAAHEAIRPFIPLVGQLAGAFLTIGSVAGPLFASLSGGFANLLKQFVDFINAEADSGGLAKFFDDALVVLHQLGTILGGVFGLIMQILGALQSTGGESLGVLGRIVGMLNDFFGSAEGHQALVGIFTLFNTVLESLFQVLTPLLPAIGQLATVLSGGLTRAVVTLTPYLVKITDYLGKHPALLGAAVTAWGAYRAALIAVSVAEGIMDALNPVGWVILAVAAIAGGAYLIYKNWSAVGPFFAGIWHAIVGFFQGIWDWIVSVGSAIGTWFTVTMPGWFAALPGRIWGFISSIPSMLWNLFLSALHLAGEAVGVGVGLILAAFIKTPGLVWDALKSIGHLIADIWRLGLATARAVIDSGVNAVVFTFTVLPGRIANFIGRIPGILRDGFRSAWNWARREVEDGANAVVGFVQRLPGRISGFMRNVGHDILGGLKSGINAVVSGFNAGIDRVAGFIHIGLPHLPMFAAGGLINAPTLAVVGEAGPEAIVPMSDPGRARDVARKTGLLDMIGSASHSEIPNVHVYLGNREITDILNVQIDKKLNDQANELSYGTR